jgi:hypothetical protein
MAAIHRPHLPAAVLITRSSTKTPQFCARPSHAWERGVSGDIPALPGNAHGPPRRREDGRPPLAGERITYVLSFLLLLEPLVIDGGQVAQA